MPALGSEVMMSGGGVFSGMGLSEQEDAPSLRSGSAAG